MSGCQKQGTCPICNKTFSINLLNSHANKCLGESGDTGDSQDSVEIIGTTVNTLSHPNSKKRKSTEHDKQTWENIFKRQSQSSKKVKIEIDTTGSTLSGKDGISPYKQPVVANNSSKQFTSNSSKIPCQTNGKEKLAPLPEQVRPKTLEEYVGQIQAIGPKSLLRSILKTKCIPSLIFWGPPGCGKTTLAKLIANHCKKEWNAKFVQLSAAAAGVADVKEVVKVAKNDKQMFKRRTILFLDEIHRFNKTQQDSLLPHVEDGTIVLLGATTENPSFHVNSALLSRSRVIVLEKLSCEDLERILNRAAESLGVNVFDEKVSLPDGENNGTIVIEREAMTALANLCDGDARSALNCLEITVQSCMGEGHNVITMEMVKESLQRSHVLYDKTGEEHYNCLSALQKSIRGSDPSAALYWTARMLEGGEKPLVVARRLVRIASEDIGLADPQCLPLAVAAYQASHLVGMPECDVILAQCVVQLARSPKSTEVYLAYERAKKCVRTHEGPMPGVPLHLRNASTKLMKDLGYGKGYKGRPDEDGTCNQEYFPDGLKGTNFFK